MNIRSMDEKILPARTRASSEIPAFGYIKKLITTETDRAITVNDVDAVLDLFTWFELIVRGPSFLNKIRSSIRLGEKYTLYSELILKDMVKAFLTDEKVDFSKYLSANINNAEHGRKKISIDFKQTHNYKLANRYDEFMYLVTKYTIREIGTMLIVYTMSIECVEDVEN